jgi:integrase
MHAVKPDHVRPDCSELREIAYKMPALSDTFARTAGPGKHWDGRIAGFGLFVGKKAKTWYFQKDVRGRTQRTRIGAFPVVSAAEARQAALKLQHDLATGAARYLVPRRQTLRSALDDYVSRPKLRSDTHKLNVRIMIERECAEWLNLDLREIRPDMAADLHKAMRQRPVLANHTLQALRAIWNHARRANGALPESPTRAVEWYEEKPDGRIIEDLSVWRERVSALENPIHAAFYEFLLRTGLRKTECASLTWSQIQQNALRIEAQATKNGRPLDLPLLHAHHCILDPMRGLHRTFVFPAASRSGHIITPERLPWSAHAHRRTFATVGAEIGILEEVVGRLLGHTPLSVTARHYQRPSTEALREPMKRIVSEIESRLKGALRRS